jgi:hypothetical protein
MVHSYWTECFSATIQFNVQINKMEALHWGDVNYVFPRLTPGFWCVCVCYLFVYVLNFFSLLLFVGGLMSYLHYLCLCAQSGIQHILCCVFLRLVHRGLSRCFPPSTLKTTREESKMSNFHTTLFQNSFVLVSRPHSP